MVKNLYRVASNGDKEPTALEKKGDFVLAGVYKADAMMLSDILAIALEKNDGYMKDAFNQVVQELATLTYGDTYAAIKYTSFRKALGETNAKERFRFREDITRYDIELSKT